VATETSLHGRAPNFSRRSAAVTQEKMDDLVRFAFRRAGPDPVADRGPGQRPGAVRRRDRAGREARELALAMGMWRTQLALG
jgi:hypothetical protein